MGDRKQRAAEAMGPLVGSDKPITVASWEACRAFRHFGCRFTEPVPGLPNEGPEVCVRCAADMAWEATA